MCYETFSFPLVSRIFVQADPGPAGGAERAARDAMLRAALQRRRDIDGEP